MPRSSFSKTFFKTFPPPAFINMPYGGIDISDYAVHCLEFKMNHHKKVLEIARYDSRSLPPGVVEGGYVKDEAALTTVTAELVKKLGIVRVKASLPEEKVYLFRTDVPSLDTKEIAQNIESKLEENVPLSPADAIFHFRMIPGTMSASVSVVPAKVVETYLRVLKNAGLTVFSFEMQARAVTHALISKDSEETVMIVHAMDATGNQAGASGVHKKAGIYVVYRGIVCFTVTIPIEDSPSQDIFKALKEVTGYWLDHGVGNEAIQENEVNTTKNAVGRIVICGPDPIRTAVESAAAELKIPVAPANVWTNAFSTASYTPPITADDSLGYAVAAGLALPEKNYSEDGSFF